MLDMPTHPRCMGAVVSAPPAADRCGHRRAASHELVEQHAVMHERLAQMLGVGQVWVQMMALPGSVGGAVMLNGLGMVGGDELGTFVEIPDGVDRVATLVHHIHDKPVCLVKGRPGPVDEVGLHGLPASEVTLAGRGLQRANVKPIAPIHDCAEVPRRIALTAACTHLALVLGTESLLQVDAATTPRIPYHEQHGRPEHNDPNGDLDDDDGVHDQPPHPFY